MTLMTLTHLQNTKSTLWQRPQVQAWLSTLSSARIAADQAEIDKVMARATLSPMAMRALAWARAHEVGIVLDHKAKGAGAYYLPGAGVIALLPSSTGSAEFFDVRTLVHEIRHAWQDHYGLLPSWTQDRWMHEGNIIASMWTQALFEADAHAHDWAVKQECKTGQKTTIQNLRQNFIDWHRSKGKFYTGFERDKHAAVLQIGAITSPTIGAEVMPLETVTRNLGVQAGRDEDIMRLGKSFLGKNYLAGWYYDAVARQWHAPDTVMRSFNTAAPRDRIIEAVLKKQIANRLAAPVVVPRRKLPG